MKTIQIRSLTTKAALVAVTVAMLMGFASLTQRAERSAERALETVVATQGKLYAAPASPTVQLATVVITGKRPS